MRQVVWSRILVVIMSVGVTQGFLVFGSRFIRSNQEYQLVATNFNGFSVDLLVRIEGSAPDGSSTLNITQEFNVSPNMNRPITFNIPKLGDGAYKMTIDGQLGFNYHQEVELEYKNRSISGLVQMDKPVVKSGESVRFRVILLDLELKPPKHVETVQVTVRDPDGNTVRNWTAGRLHFGVFEGVIQIAPTPLLGNWHISASVEGAGPISKTFVVKEHVPSTFDVQVVPTTIPLLEHQGLSLTVSANHYFGKPVKGTVTLELYLDENILDQAKTWEVDGVDQVQLDFMEPLEMYDTQQDVHVNVTFIEQFTNRTVNKQERITVYRHQLRLVLVQEYPAFRPGLPYHYELHLQYHDGKPAPGVSVKVQVYILDQEHEWTLTSDENGVIEQTFHPSESSYEMFLRVEADDGELLGETIYGIETPTDAFLKVERKSNVALNSIIELSITCTDKMSFLVVYVISKGNIVHTKYMKPSSHIDFRYEINATSNMMPRSKIVVAALAQQVLMFDAIDIEFDELSNNFHLSINDHEVRPGVQIQLDMRGRPGSYVALAAYDRNLLEHSTNHDVFWEDIQEVFDDFHGTTDNIFDPLHSIGMFARTLDKIQLPGVYDRSARDGTDETAPIPYRTNFLESWLWKNLTMPVSGNHTLIEYVPDTTTTWYLTGFSIDPVYGLGIIKKPIELTAV